MHLRKIIDHLLADQIYLVSTKKVEEVQFVLLQVRTFPNASDQIIDGEPQIHVRAELDVKALIRSQEVSQMMLE